MSTDYPNIRPSLLLDFANTKKLDPRITFTRTTTATYYDGVTTAKAEENLLTYSQDFSNVVWNQEQVTLTGSQTAPDGSSTAWLLTDNAVSVDHRIFIFPAASAATYSVFSAYLKNGTRQYAMLRIGGTTYAGAVFNLSAGTVSSTGGSAYYSSSITSVGNGWYRCVVIGSNISSSPNAVIALSHTATYSDNIIYSGSGQTIYAWGAQLEQRSSATAYTATTTQAITNYIPVLQTASAGQARFDHNPTTDESLGLLVEEQRTNLLTYSAESDNAAWIKTRANITANTIVAPDGTLTGDKFYDDSTASATHNIGQSTSFTSGTTYTFSIYAKIGERNLFRVVLPSAAFGTAVAYNFDLSAGTTTLVTAGTGNTSSITAVGNGWYRCVVTAHATSTTSGSPALFLVNVNTITYTGNGYSGIFIWGAQLEEGAFPTSYIATTSATVTRNADVASMTGTNFSSWFNAAEGAIYCESQTAYLAQGQGIWAIGNPSLSFGSGNMMYAGYNSGLSGRIVVDSFTNGSQQVNLGVVVSQTANTFSKSAYVYKVNDFAQTTNAASVFTDTSGTVPIGPTGLSIGGLSQGWSGASTPVNGTIKKIAYYPLRVTNAQLQALTS